MPRVTVQLETPICRTFRVEQVAGMLDLSLKERPRHSLTAEVPGLDEAWRIGAIVGPSGSGKTTLARAAFGEAIYERREWPRERAIVEVIGEASVIKGKSVSLSSIKEIARVLAAVGLGSVPTWLKPYEVLSTGEKFRADLARALLEGGRNLTQRHRGAEQSETSSVLVMDEFTSSLDRTVARTTSAALSRLLRRPTMKCEIRNPHLPRFVAVTCHDDILPWLAPDWVVDLDDPCRPRLIRERPEPAKLALRIERVRQALWERFAKYHYLEGGLAASATCYGAWVAEEMAPVAFCAVVAALGWPRTKRITRLVVLPEFQGLGVGSLLAQEVALREQARGNRVTITASHPAIISHCSHSPHWRYLGIKKNGSTRQRMNGREVRSSLGRAVASFEFVG